MDKEKGIKIELSKEAEDGVYSNLAVISHSNSEFVIDFAKFLPGKDGAKVHSRIIMSPIHAKQLRNTLANNIKNFEEKVGEITIPDVQPENNNTIN